MNRNLSPRSYSLICKTLGLAILIGSLIGCNPLSVGTSDPSVTIANAAASRDPGTGLPVVVVDYTVKYPNGAYAQTLPSVPTLSCTMKQTQLTRERIFNGAPINITGTSITPQNGKVTIAVPESGKFIAGDFSIICKLATDRTLGTSNGISVNVPKSPDAANVDPNAEKYVGSFTGAWNTNWGDMTCMASSISVHCEYTHDQGKIEATLLKDGRTLEGQWSESPSYAPPQDAGRVTLTISDDGKSMSGDWSYGQGASEGPWTGTRK
jgi:hypothetical protein